MSDSSLQSNPASFVRFSTEDYPARERVEAWREVFGRTVVNVNIEPLEPATFHAEALLYKGDGFGVMYATAAPARQSSSRALIGGDDLSFGIGPRCPWSIAQLGRSPNMKPGDGVLLSNGEPGSITLTRECSYMAFCVPTAAMKARVTDLGAALVRPIPGPTPALRLLAGYLRVARHTGALCDTHAQPTFATHVHDLLALALGAKSDAAHAAREQAVPVARLRTLLAYIDAHYRDPGLSAEKVAKAQGISLRYLHRLIEPTGTSFSARINELRLQRAFRLLSDPGATHLRIADIALQSGYSDISYFNRKFAARFGSSPSGVRATRHG